MWSIRWLFCWLGSSREKKLRVQVRRVRRRLGGQADDDADKQATIGLTAMKAEPCGPTPDGQVADDSRKQETNEDQMAWDDFFWREEQLSGLAETICNRAILRCRS